MSVYFPPNQSNASAHARAALPEANVAPLRRMHPRAGNEYRLADQPVGGATKRIFDFVAAALALVVLSPILLAIALLIRLDSPGPALFQQRRGGFRGRIFRIYKFRTMRTQEDGRNVAQAVAGDARVTRIGGFLRKTSLDEVPQLINVLRGEMSLVGPRPHAILHEHEFRRFDLDYTRRRMARPGITGLSQVSGARGITDTPEKVAKRIKLDLAYVQHWSIWLDLMILIRTVMLVFSRDPLAV